MVCKSQLILSTELGFSLYDEIDANLKIDANTTTFGSLGYKTDRYLYELGFGYNEIKYQTGRSILNNFSSSIGIGFGIDLFSKSKQHDLLFLGGPIIKIYDKVDNNLFQSGIRYGLHTMFKYTNNLSNLIGLNIGTRLARDLWGDNGNINQIKVLQNTFFIGLSININGFVKEMKNRKIERQK